MVEENDSENSERTQNKGVNVTSDSLPADHSNCNPITVRNLKNQVQNLINQMGPTTPHLTQNSSSEADNEESIFETSIFSSVYKAKTEVKTKHVPEKTDSSTREISECSALASDDVPNQKEKYHCSTKYRKLSPSFETKSCCCQCKTNCEYAGGSPLRFHVSRKDQYKNKCFLSKMLNKKQRSFEVPLELYKMDVMQCENDHSPPRKLVFNLVESLPQPPTNSVGSNTNPLLSVTKGITARKLPIQDLPSGQPVTRRKQVITKTTVLLDGGEEARVDVYYFDHGNSGYYETTDCLPYLMTEMLADRTEIYTTKFWAELFGTIHIGFSFCTSFILQLLRFVLYSVVRPLTVGLIQLASDYFFKPCLTISFNGVIQPTFIFLYNIATSLRDLCNPIAEGIGYFFREIAVMLRAIRVVEIRKGGKCCVGDKKPTTTSCKSTTCEIGSEIPKSNNNSGSCVA